ncbi:MAG: hypothetical protein Q9162_007131 [Coniocarpon cinnabarinum]
MSAIIRNHTRAETPEAEPFVYQKRVRLILGILLRQDRALDMAYLVERLHRSQIFQLPVPQAPLYEWLQRYAMLHPKTAVRLSKMCPKQDFTLHHSVIDWMRFPDISSAALDGFVWREVVKNRGARLLRRSSLTYQERSQSRLSPEFVQKMHVFAILYARETRFNCLGRYNRIWRLYKVLKLHQAAIHPVFAKIMTLTGVILPLLEGRLVSYHRAYFLIELEHRLQPDLALNVRAQMERLAVTSARLLSQKSHVVPGALKITEHFFEVPLQHGKPGAPTLRLFARSAHKHTVPLDSASSSNGQAHIPWLLYLQGGPGFECRSPQSYPFTKSFLDKGYGVIFLDQRGTGLSSPITAATLKQQGNVEDQARYLSHFRADNIVRDAEAVRLALVEGWPEEKKKWSLIGQSFGGFCAVTYLSMFPSSLREAFIAGGLPPMHEKGPDGVYRRLVKQVVKRNEDYYGKYPEDVERVKQIVRHIQQRNMDGEQAVAPSGGVVLSERRFLQMGIALGFHGGIDGVHDTVLRASSEIDSLGLITRATASTICTSGGGYDTNPLYCILHEPLYCQGHPSRWSASRTVHGTPEFSLEDALNDPGRPVYFTGEMVFPWMLEDYSELQEMALAAENMANKMDWPHLYDVHALQQNEVPVYAAIYTEDMYVDCNTALETARNIRNCKYYLTNRIYHDGLRSRMDNVVETLWKLRTDVID